MTINGIKINTPLDPQAIKSIRAGESYLLSGTIFSARDKAHERIAKLVQSGCDLPINFSGQIIYYMGPSPTPPGHIIGSAGPTTSSRMDSFSRLMLQIGIKGMIGKGKRDQITKDLLKEYKAVYFSSYGGAGAYLGSLITACEVAAFEDLGPEAIYKLSVKNFPLVAINDIYGGDLYEFAVNK